MSTDNSHLFTTLSEMRTKKIRERTRFSIHTASDGLDCELKRIAYLRQQLTPVGVVLEFHELARASLTHYGQGLKSTQATMTRPPQCPNSYRDRSCSVTAGA